MQKNMNSALATKNPELARLLNACNEEKLREVALKSAAKALYVTGATKTMNKWNARTVNSALESAEAEDFGNSEHIGKLRKLADEAEAQYLKHLDEDTLKKLPPEVRAGFEKARALTALYLALDSDIKKQAGNAVYEALYAGVEVADVKRYLEGSRA